MTELTKDWSDYNPEEGYEKSMQDVMLKDGTVLLCCWPNAGVWNIMDRSSPRYTDEVPVTDTLRVRLTHDKHWQ